MAHPTGLSTKQLLLLGRLKRLRALGGFYLAGGSAVGWHYSHRRSMDLDFFSVDDHRSLDPVVSALTKEGGQVRGETDVTVTFELKGVPVDVVRYPYCRRCFGPTQSGTARPPPTPTTWFARSPTSSTPSATTLACSA